jgi:hypothetical protein
MKKFYLLASMLLLVAATAATLPDGRVAPSSSLGPNNLSGDSMAGDLSRLNSGAFRDGLFLGRFTAERGRPRRVVSGRWATADNRALFAAGYEQGYGEFIRAAIAEGEKSE